MIILKKGFFLNVTLEETIEDDIFYAMVEPIDMIEFQENTNQKLVENDIDTQQNPFIITFSISELEK